MKEILFVERYTALWETIERSLNARFKGGEAQHFPAQFRMLCHHLSLAKHRQYSPQLVDRLNSLVIRAHSEFYQRNYNYRFQWLNFLLVDFPRAVRVNKYFILIAALLFALPLLASAIAAYFSEDFIYSILKDEQLKQMEALYDPTAEHLGRERASQTDVAMFGFYIYNNIGVGFRSFASGIVFGLGSIFFMIYNGLHIGGVAGHLSQLGYIETFYGFIAGHGSFELSAIVLCGGAGLRLGYTLLRPGSLPRIQALRASGRESIAIVYGAMQMLIIAAFIEAFWSSSTSVPFAVKLAVGLFFWLVVLSYLLLAGRRFESE